MTTFEDREQFFEAGYHHDEEINFRIAVRLARLAARWAARRMELPEAEGEAYVKSVVESDVAAPGHHDLVARLHGDLVARGLDVSAHRVQRKLQELLPVAREQVMTE